VRRDLPHGWVFRLRILDFSKREVSAELGLVELLSELIDALYVEVTSVGVNVTTGNYLIVGEVVVAHEAEPG
jgi:hypothetical protein